MAHARLNLQRMLDWIERNRDFDIENPTDAEIMDRFGFDSPEHARTLLAELADAGKITIKGYGDTRVITLGRTKSSFAAGDRPEPAVKRADPVIDEAVAKIAAIVARGPKAGAPIVTLPKPIAQPSPAPPPRQEKPVMPKPEAAPAKRAITFNAEGAMLRRIERTASEKQLPLGRVAIDLIEAAMRGPDTASAPPAPVLPMTVDQLLAALRDRIEEAGRVPDRSDEIEALTERAETAERKLDALRAALA